MATGVHSKVIFHIDIDYFYAQCEEIMNPSLKDKPFGVQQGLNVVTCNYIAREYGIKKWRTVKECLEKCPDMVLVRGEDLSNYKDYSVKVSELIHEILGPSERMGLDEHTVDITKQVEDQMAAMTDEEIANLRFTGPFYPSEEAFSECECGCDKKLMIGSKIASEVRDKIFEELKLTCSAGVAHNKFLAKLCGGLNKPNNQTTLAPLSAAKFMLDLEDPRKIVGIGGKTAQRIVDIGIESIKELQQVELEKLKKSFSHETATRLKELSLGIDNTEVKPTGKPKTIGLEHSCPPTMSVKDAHDNFKSLLARLMVRLEKTELIPHMMRVTVRKYHLKKKVSVKESKQCPIAPTHFKNVGNKIQLADGADEKILKEAYKLHSIIMEKSQDPANLFGLCFGKFEDVTTAKVSIKNFFKKEELADEPPPKRIKIDESVKCADKNADNIIPDNIDKDVWDQLPSEIQFELLRSWQASRALKSSTSRPETGSKSSILGYLRKE